MFADKLRKSLLQAAIQGRLTEQLPTDGDARDLLKKIRDEKAKLIATKKIKAEKPLPPISDDEIPFELPANWCWCRLGEICQIQSSKRIFEKDYVSNGVPFFRSKEIGDLSRNESIKTRLYISRQHYEILRNSVGVPQTDDILITSVGSIGNAWICDGREFYYKDGNITQICKNEHLISKYVVMFIYSSLFFSQINDSVSGTVYNALTIIKLKRIIFPLPPLAEQKRIVERLDALLFEVAELAKDERELNLHVKNFPRKMKNSLLQAAIQGQLTEQLPTDGDARDLLKKIRDEKAKLIKAKKIKAEKPLPPVTDDEIPFELPANWCWCRLGDIGTWGAGATPLKGNPAFYENATIPWLVTGDLNDGLITNVPRKISALALEKTSVKLNPIDSVLVAMYGATIGKIGMLTFPATTNQACCACQTFEDIEPWYLMFFLMFQRRNFIKQGVGGAQPNISKEKIISTLFPLPPLAEQLRIVERLNELLPLCEI